MTLLAVQGLTVQFGGLVALDDLALEVQEGDIHGVIGPNGAGKTTLLNVVTRLQAPTRGAAMFDGLDLLAASPHDVPRLGICRTFQHVELFGGLTVAENVMLGHLTRARSGFTGALLRSRGARRDLGDALARAMELLALVGLADLAHREAAALPFAQQKLVGVARALASGPRLLLLDEPAAGMTTAEVAPFGEFLQRVRRDWGMTILVVEHVMELVMSVCDRVTVLNYGRKIADGTPAAVREDPTVIEAYLGSRARHA